MQSFSKLFDRFKNREAQVTLGRLKGNFWVKERLTESQLNHHVHIVGASGFGKTVLLGHFARQRIEQGKGFLFVDLKGDLETIIKFRSYASTASRDNEIKVFSLTDQNISTPYNLVSEGTPTQLRDKIIGSLIWSEEFYKNQSSSALLRLLIILCWLRDNRQIKFHIGTILDAINDVQKFIKLADQIPDAELNIKTIALDLHKFLKSPDNYSSLQGLRTQLESVVYSDFGKLVTSVDGIDLYESIQSGQILIFLLDSRRYGETSKVLGKLVIQDLKMVTARIDAEIRKVDRKPFTVVIDEFADFAQEEFIGLLDRARSSKMSIIVAHQEIADLLKVSPEFARRLMGNTSTIYAFLQKSPESAEMLAKVAGTKLAWKETLQATSILGISIPSGEKSLRQVEEFHIHPNKVKSLQVGECVCIKKYPTSKAYIVKVHAEHE